MKSDYFKGRCSAIEDKKYIGMGAVGEIVRRIKKKKAGERTEFENGYVRCFEEMDEEE